MQGPEYAQAVRAQACIALNIRTLYVVSRGDMGQKKAWLPELRSEFSRARGQRQERCAGRLPRRGLVPVSQDAVGRIG